MNELEPYNDSYPIFVDLDGSLTRTDVLVESFFGLIKKNLFYLFLIPSWLLKGKAHLKQMIADRVDLDVHLLPFQQEFLDYLADAKNRGREVYLATASNIKYARKIADHLGVFSGVIASGPEINMSGSNKLAAIRETVGDSGFEYAANAQVDIKIWQHAESCVLVNPDPTTERHANANFRVRRTFKDPKGGLKAYINAIRVHQWMKNVLLLLPILAAHKISDAGLLLDVLLGIASFSLCASSVYLLNDLLDLPADRSHPQKRKRPFAAGTIQPLHGALLIPVLLLSGFLIALLLPTNFIIVLLIYYICTVAYSFFLKRIVMIDVLVLAALYTIRVVAGAAATGITLSFWLLAFSMFIFLSLALVKRSTELISLKKSNKENTAGRGYRVSDLEYLHSMGVTSGYMSVLVMALYINSEQVIMYYSQPEIIWFICPVLLYWISRVWLKTGRGEMPDDPLVFAFKDRQSQLLGVFIVMITTLATVVK